MKPPRPMTIRQRVEAALIRTAAPPVGDGQGITVVDLDDAITVAIADLDHDSGGMLADAVQGLDLDVALSRILRDLRSEGWSISTEGRSGHRVFHLVSLPTGVIDRKRAGA